jgi:selenium metabolism protein YedF
MNTKIDCRDLDCPQPVLKTKDALEAMEEGILDVLVNSISSIENVKRFAKKNGYEVSEKKDNETTIISIIKGYECAIVKSPKDDEGKFLEKSIFIKTDKVGVGDLGDTLMKGFLKTTLEFEKLPKNIILVNEGVFLSTKKEYQEVTEILKEFEKRGVKIYSCGLCMNFYNIAPEELKVGEIGNAYDTMDMLLHTEVISL